MKLGRFLLALSLARAAPVASAFAFNVARVGGPHSPIFAGRTTSSRCRPLFGIMDEVNSDSFDLLGKSVAKTGGRSKAMEDAYETFLAELVFSPNDPRLDIVENYDRCVDKDWLDWLDKKVASSTDPEERIALRDLYELILDVQKKIELKKLADERAAKEAEEAERQRLEAAEAEAEEGRALSASEVLKKAAAVKTGGLKTGPESEGTKASEKKSFYDEELTPEIRMSYEGLLKKVLPPYKAGDTPASIVFNYYDQFDAQFVKVLTERSKNGDTDSKALLEALASEQQKRMAAAAETLKSVLALGGPMRMEGAIVKLAREGKIDEPFLLLLEANANQAKAAGATGPAELMLKLKNRAVDEKDKQTSSKEIKLLRKLLRADTSEDREKLLEDAFTPKETLLVPGTAANAAKAMEGERPEEEKPMPEVPPPDFINACKAVLINFGNLAWDDDRGDLATRVKQIAAEAEVVATRIYGKGMSPKEQQDRMWSEQTTSIFDLERMEIEAERMGSSAPWSNPDAGDDILPGFDKDGRMRIGGG